MNYKKASTATNTISDAVDKATHALAMFSGRTVNGLGIFGDPSLLRGYLHEATTALDIATKEFRSTEWPTRADYDRDHP